MKCFKNQAGPVFGVVGLFAVLLILSSTAYGDSKKWRANNNSDKKIKVFWTADGCAGVKPHCDVSSNDLIYVCKTKILQPGQSSYYKFKEGTSRRQKKACRMDGDHTMRLLDKTSGRKKNGIRIKGNGAAQWYVE